MSFIVAIDGPAGTGKGTMASRLSKKYNLVNIDTGATYRCVTLEMMNQNIGMDEEEKIAEMLKSIQIELSTEKGKQKVFLNGQDVTDKIRSKEVSANVSPVSSIKQVRVAMAGLQRKMAQGKDVIMEGRDIGTVIFPNADVKIYLNANVEVRAKRRVKQNEEKGIEMSYEEVLENIKKRDKNDMEKEMGALKVAEDAVVIDGSEMTIKEVEKAITETGIKDVEKKLIRNLSRGYKQRVSMAGALVGSPDVLILDEPTVGLDPKQITEIRSLIKELGKEHTVILSSHILSEVSQLCERVIIINKGKIVAIDTPENLEKATQEKNIILVTVEDKQNKMKEINTLIPEIAKCEEVKDNGDGTKQYMIEAKKNADLRKQLFEVLPKNDITIFELKKAETSLEDAFITLINKSSEKAKKEGGKK